MNPSSVLVVGRNPLLAQVIRSLMPPPPPTVRTAEGIDEALSQPALHSRLAVIDWPAGEDASRLLSFREFLGPTSLVVMAGNPAELPAFPADSHPPPRIVAQPADLDVLRKTLQEAWQPSEPGGPNGAPSRFMRAASFLIGVVVVAVGLLLILPMLHVPFVPNVLKMIVARREAVPAPPATPIHLIEGKPDVFSLDEDSALAMKIPRPHPISTNPERRQLTLSGSLAFDPDRLGRVQPRFQGEVITIGKSEDPATDPKGRTILDAPLSYGNRVRKGQLMAVIWSKDLGEKKSELVDWLVKLSLDEENLKHLKELWLSGAGSEANYRQAKNTVSADLNGVARVRRTLETWKVEDKEIKDIEKEADRIIATRSLTELRQMKSSVDRWARVEVVAPFDGIIVEKNLAIGNIVDSSQDLYKVADLRKVAVFANAYEEDQRLLQDMQAQQRPSLIPWRVHLTADPEKKALPSDGIERIGYIVDPQQRTNLVIGKVENKDERLRVGQSVTALVDVPPPPGVVSIPASALVEDGADSVVFVQPDPNKLVYVMKRVSVVQRFNGQAYVRSMLDKTQKKAGLKELTPGEWVVASAVVELKAALEEVQARARR